jgi:hypothetical protein
MHIGIHRYGCFDNVMVVLIGIHRYGCFDNVMVVLIGIHRYGCIVIGIHYYAYHYVIFMHVSLKSS